MNYRALLVAAIMVAGNPLAAGAANKDSDVCEDTNNIGSSGIAACTRIISAGVAKGRDLAKAYYDRGMKYHMQNNHDDEAIKDFSQAIRVDPSWSWPFVARGHAYADKREFASAFADQGVAIRLEPTAVTYIGRARDLVAAGEYDRAMADIDQAISLNPKYFYAFMTRGDVHLKTREFEKAISDYNTALAIGGTSNLTTDYVRDNLKRAHDELGR